MPKPTFPRKIMPTVAEYCSAPGAKNIKNKEFVIQCKIIKKKNKEAIAQYYEKLREWNNWRKEQQPLRVSNVKARKHARKSLPGVKKEVKSEIKSDGV